MLNYINKKTTPTATQMNALFAEFDGKLSDMCAGGRSFILNRGNLHRLMGKAFFFISGKVYHSPSVNGYVATATAHEGVSVSEQLTLLDAKAAAASITAYDDTKRIATIANFTFTSAESAKLPAVTTGQGYLDHSPRAHYRIVNRTINGVTDNYKFYLRESRATVNERHHDWAVAEIIIEGTTIGTTISVPIVDVDKYRFFRVHNLTRSAVTVNFTGSPGHALVVSAFGCKATRRLADDTFEDGWNYFWKFRAGEDPMFFWTLPATIGSSGTITECKFGSTSPQNAMVANNITNPAIIYEFVYTYTGMGMGGISMVGTGQSGYWYRDPLVHAELSEADREKLFGDPANPTTLLGDLIQHKGLILRCDTMKDEFVSGTTTRVQRFTLFKFNGWSTLVADFAAAGITVTFPGGGQVRYSAAGLTDRAVSLIPISTNLFFDGETQPSTRNVIVLSSISGSSISSTPLTIDYTLKFDDQNAVCSRNTVAPDLIRGRTLTSHTNQVTDDFSTKTGTPLRELSVALTSKTGTLIPFSTTVANLLTLQFWGSTAAAATYVTYSNAALKLTVFGLVLTFTENANASYHPAGAATGILPTYNFNNADAIYFAGPWRASGGQMVRDRCIKFRGHGWGYPDAGMGTAFFLSPFAYPELSEAGLTNQGTTADGADLEGYDRDRERFARRILTRVAIAPSGDSFVTAGGVAETQIRSNALGSQMWELRTGAIDWITQVNNRKAAAILPLALDGMTDTGFELLNRLTPAQLYVDGASVLSRGTEYNYLLFSLATEHYNGFASVVNSLNTLRKLSYERIYFWNASTSSWFNLAYNAASKSASDACPKPITMFRELTDAEVPTWEDLGFTVRGEADLPDSYNLLSDANNYTFHKVVESYSVVTASATVVGGQWSQTPAPSAVWLYGGYITEVEWTEEVKIESTPYVPTGLIGFDDFPAAYTPGNPTYQGYAMFHETGIDIKTKFQNIKWVTIDDVQAFVEGMGFEFQFAQYAVGYKLEVVERSSELGAGGVAPYSPTRTRQGRFDYTGSTPPGPEHAEQFTVNSGVSGVGTPQPSYTPEVVVPGEGIYTTVQTTYRVSKFPLFSPVTDEQAEWIYAAGSVPGGHNRVSDDSTTWQGAAHDKKYRAEFQHQWNYTINTTQTTIEIILDNVGSPTDPAYKENSYVNTVGEKKWRKAKFHNGTFGASNTIMGAREIVVITRNFPGLTYTLVPAPQWGIDYDAVPLDNRVITEAPFVNIEGTTPESGAIAENGVTVISAPAINAAYKLYVSPIHGGLL